MGTQLDAALGDPYASGFAKVRPYAGTGSNLRPSLEMDEMDAGAARIYLRGNNWSWRMPADVCDWCMSVSARSSRSEATVR